MGRIGTFGQMLEDEKSGVQDFTKDGKCSGCGNCCTNFLHVSDVEIKRIRAYVGKHGITERMCRYPMVEPIIDMQCPFRDESGKRCAIYPVRPAICRDFRCDMPREKIEANRLIYQRRYALIDMRAVFFGRENGLIKMMKEIL